MKANSKQFFINGVVQSVLYDEPVKKELLINFGFKEYLTNQYKLEIGDLSGTHLQFYSKDCEKIMMAINDPKNDYNLIKPIKIAGRFLDLYEAIIGLELQVVI